MPYDFEYWRLPYSDDIKTKINRCYKSGKYIVFVREDGKECRYDLQTGETIGFRGKPVKSLASQLKDLTCERLFKIIDNPVYREYLQYVWHMHRNGKAWVFFKYTMPEYIGYEQFFTSGFRNLQYHFDYTFNQVPKGLLKLCTEFNIPLTNKLYEEYIRNPNAFNLLFDYEFEQCSTEDIIDAMLYGHVSEKYYRRRYHQNTQISPQNLLVYKTEKTRKNEYNGRDSYFWLLINNFSYNAKLLLDYVDSIKIRKKFKKTIFRDIYDYAAMMDEICDKFNRYPENLPLESKKAIAEYNKLQIIYNETAYKSRNVLNYECEIDGFRFIYPRSTEEIKKEGVEQHNCVACYISRVLDDKCHIMFMRPLDNLSKSYITLEIVNNKIVQAKRKYNRNPDAKEREVIRKWNEKYNRHS